MSVRAKFTCTAVTKYPSGSKIEMSAVYSSTGENADFAESTPSGTFSMMISEGKPAASAFTPGKAYYLDFSEAQAVEALVSPSLEAPPAPSNPTPAEPDAWAVLDKDGDVWSAWAERDVCQNEIRRKEHPQKYAPYTVQPLYLARAGSSAPTEGKP